MWSCRFWMNCFLVLSYINILRHYLWCSVIRSVQARPRIFRMPHHCGRSVRTDALTRTLITLINNSVRANGASARTKRLQPSVRSNRGRSQEQSVHKQMVSLKICYKKYVNTILPTKLFSGPRHTNIRTNLPTQATSLSCAHVLSL